MLRRTPRGEDLFLLHASILEATAFAVQPRLS